MQSQSNDRIVRTILVTSLNSDYAKDNCRRRLKWLGLFKQQKAPLSVALKQIVNARCRKTRHGFLYIVPMEKKVFLKNV